MTFSTQLPLLLRNTLWQWLMALVAVVIVSGCGNQIRKGSVLPAASSDKSDTRIGNSHNDTNGTLYNDNGKMRVDQSLSPASILLVQACDNYLEISPENPRAVEVYMIKASLYYNSKLYESARSVYEKVMMLYNGSPYMVNAMRMMAQSFYEEKKFDQAEKWYKKLSETSSDSIDKSEAVARIAESIFRLAEINEAEGKLENAAQEYEKVAFEYPDSKIADISLFNAGLVYEKLANWSHASMTYRKMLTNYEQSKLQAKAYFRIAKCNETMLQWDAAAETYLIIASRFSADSLATTAMYNAGFCFENGEKYLEAAAVFEKMVQLFPTIDDAADILFRSGELYGKVKEWGAVARVTTLFAKRFGNDEDRIVQALCMNGVALYMRNRSDEAVRELERAVTVYKRLKKPGTVNAFYAAKAMYTIGEIYHEKMREIRLGAQDKGYRKALVEKSEMLDKGIDCYTAVVKFNLLEWTTRAVFQIGQLYEDFGRGILGRERPANMPLEKRISLELGIAEAVENYFIDKSMSFHIKNVKLGIKEKIEDTYVTQSLNKLTWLPYIASENYLAIVEIVRSADSLKKQEGLSSIAGQLLMLQKIAPFQKRAIELYMQCLENGATYHHYDEFYKKASASITGVSLSVGLTYANVVNVARNAPIPEVFDDYEQFVYKTKLLRQIEGYEDQALENFLKTIKIAEAYKLEDTSVTEAKKQIGILLFNRGRSYDLLCINAFSYPPFPRGVGEEEKEVYKVRFEEIGLKFQEQAFEIYKNVLEFAGQSYAEGVYVTHAYIRLYQNFPEQYGVKSNVLRQKTIGSGPQWLLTQDSVPEWFTIGYNDSLWQQADRSKISGAHITGFPESIPIPLWIGEGKKDTGLASERQRQLFMRRKFVLDHKPEKAMLYLSVQGNVSLYVNDQCLFADSALTFSVGAAIFDLSGRIKNGANIIGIKIVSENNNNQAVYPLITLTSGFEVMLPKPPGYEVPMDPSEAGVDNYKFPEITNFGIK